MSVYSFVETKKCLAIISFKNVYAGCRDGLVGEALALIPSSESRTETKATVTALACNPSSYGAVESEDRRIPKGLLASSPGYTVEKQETQLQIRGKQEPTSKVVLKLLHVLCSKHMPVHSTMTTYRLHIHKDKKIMFPISFPRFF